MKKNICKIGSFFFLTALLLQPLISESSREKGTYTVKDSDRIINTSAMIFRCDKTPWQHIVNKPALNVDVSPRLANEYRIEHPVKLILSPEGEEMTGFNLIKGHGYPHTSPFKLELGTNNKNDKSELDRPDKLPLIIKQIGEVIDNNLKKNIPGLLATVHNKDQCYEPIKIYMSGILGHILKDLYQSSHDELKSKFIHVFKEEYLFEHEHSLGQIWEIFHSNTGSQLHFIVFYLDQGIYGLLDYTGLKFLDRKGLKIMFGNSIPLGYEWQTISLTPLAPSSLTASKLLPPDYNVLNWLPNLETVVIYAFLLTGGVSSIYAVQQYFFPDSNANNALLTKAKNKKRVRPPKKPKEKHVKSPEKNKKKDRCDEICKTRTENNQKRQQQQQQQQQLKRQKAQEWELKQQKERQQQQEQQWRQEQQWSEEQQQKEEQDRKNKEEQERQRQRQLEQEREQRVPQDDAQAFLRDIVIIITDGTGLANTGRNQTDRDVQRNVERLLLNRLDSGWLLDDLVDVVMRPDGRVRLRYKLRNIFKKGVIDKQLEGFKEKLDERTGSGQ